MDYKGGINMGKEGVEQTNIFGNEFRIEEVEDNLDDLGIYSSEERESMLENDEISHFENGFMNGYDEDNVV